MELTLELAQDVLAAQAFSQTLGASVVAFAAGSVTLELPVHHRLLQQHGFVHGGVLAYLADNALTFAGGSVLGPQVLTGGMSIEYLKTAQRGTLRAQAQVLHSTERRATCRCSVSVLSEEASEADLLAVAQGNILAIAT